MYRVLDNADQKHVQGPAAAFDEFRVKAIKERVDARLVGKDGDEVARILLGELYVQPDKVVEAPVRDDVARSVVLHACAAHYLVNDESIVPIARLGRLTNLHIELGRRLALRHPDGRCCRWPWQECMSLLLRGLLWNARLELIAVADVFGIFAKGQGYIRVSHVITTMFVDHNAPSSVNDPFPHSTFTLLRPAGVLPCAADVDGRGGGQKISQIKICESSFHASLPPRVLNFT